MAIVTREQILTALLVKIQGMTFAQAINGKTTWAGTVSRKLKLWADVPTDQRPAAFLMERDEQDAQRNIGTGAVRRLRPWLVCYTSAKGQADVGGTHINVILEALEAALQPDNWGHGTLTLAGAAYFVRIDGTILKHPGDLDGDSMLAVPIVIEMP